MGVLFIDGWYVDTLRPGFFMSAFWKGVADARVVKIDMRETTADVSGQEIMTSDKVSLRMNARARPEAGDGRLETGGASPSSLSGPRQQTRVHR